jgi:hypothetical protein
MGGNSKIMTGTLNGMNGNVKARAEKMGETTESFEQMRLLVISTAKIMLVCYRAVKDLEEKGEQRRMKEE